MAVPVKEAALSVVKGSAATIIFFLIYLTVPILGMFAGAVAPFPALFYGIRMGSGAAAAIVLISAAAVALIDPSGALLYLVQAGVLSLSLAAFLRRGRRGAEAAAGTTAIVVGLVAAAGTAYSQVRGVNLHLLIVKGIEGTITRTVEIYRHGGISGSDLDTAREALAQSAALMTQTYPSLLVIGVATMVMVNLFLAARSPGLSGLLAVAPFRSYRNTDRLVWFLIAGGFAMVLGPVPLPWLGLNVVIVTLFLYLIQGMAIISWFFERYAVSRIMRALFYVVFALQPFLAVLVALLGLFDLWVAFRSPKTKNL